MMCKAVVCCFLQAGRNVRMNSAFSRIAWTYANYSQSLKCMPACQHRFCNFPIKRICAVVEGSNRTVSSGGYTGSVRASLNLLARQSQRYSTDKADDKTEADKADDKAEVAKESKPPGLLRRFHQTYKEHGKILVCVHLATSTVWAGIFYYAALRGVDVVPILQWLGASERIISPFTKPGVGLAAVTYLLYKLATPLRYTVTIGGTHLSVKYLRRWGYLPPIASSDTIRSMVKTKIGQVQENRSHRRRSRHHRKH